MINNSSPVIENDVQSNNNLNIPTKSYNNIISDNYKNSLQKRRNSISDLNKNTLGKEKKESKPLKFVSKLNKRMLLDDENNILNFKRYKIQSSVTLNYRFH